MQADPEYTLRIELTSPEGLGCNYTEIIGKILQVDQQLDEKTIRKEIVVAQGNVHVEFRSQELKLLRACTTGLLRHMQLVARTLCQFRDQ